MHLDKEGGGRGGRVTKREVLSHSLVHGIRGGGGGGDEREWDHKRIDGVSPERRHAPCKRDKDLSIHVSL